MVAAAENTLGLYSDSADKRLIELRIAIPNMLAEHSVFERIVEFARSNPGIKLNLMSSDVSLNLIKENVDVAIRVGKLKDADLKARRIGQDRRVAVASPPLIKRYDKLTHPRQLSAWQCISFSSVPDNFAFHKGRSTVNESAKKDIEKKRLIELLPEWRTQTLDIYAMWAKNADIKKHSRQFIDWLADTA